MFTSKYRWNELVIKSVNEVPRSGKSPLVFVDLIDPTSYETSGEFMYMPTDRNEQLPAQGTLVDVYTKPGSYNGRASLTFASIVQSPARQPMKVG